MRRLITLAIPILTILLFIFIMQSGNLIKKSLEKDDPLVNHMENMVRAANDDNWAKVAVILDHLDADWKKLLFRLQFSCERDEINYINSNIARMRGAVLAEDRTNLLIELEEVKSHWDRLGE
jgi:hypothetical protein